VGFSLFRFISSKEVIFRFEVNGMAYFKPSWRKMRLQSQSLLGKNWHLKDGAFIVHC